MYDKKDDEDVTSSCIGLQGYNYDPSIYNKIDINLVIEIDAVLVQLRGKVTSKWYQFGLRLGLPGEYLDTLKQHQEEDRLLEVLDHWLKCNPKKPTWKDLDLALNGLGVTHVQPTANSIVVYDLAGKSC